MDRFTHSTAPIKRVRGLQFGILDPDFMASGPRPALSCGSPLFRIELLCSSALSVCI